MNKTGIRCANCGNELNENQRFCSRCGLPVGAGGTNQIRRCVKCGNELNEGAAFCKRCGSPVNAVNIPSAAKKGISKKLIGVVVAAVVVLTAGIAIAAGSGDSGDKKSDRAETHNSVKEEQAVAVEQDDDTADEPAGVNQTGVYTISEYF